MCVIIVVFVCVCVCVIQQEAWPLGEANYWQSSFLNFVRILQLAAEVT